MSSAALDPAVGGDLPQTVLVPRSPLQELETSVLRAELLQEQVTQLKAALAREHESHADALMEVARACDTRARELEAQCEEKLARAEASHAGLMTAKDAAIADMERQQSKLESAHNATVVAKAAHVALLKKQIAKLEASHAAAVAKLEASHAATIAAKDSSQAAVARGLQGAGDQVERPPPADLLLCRAGVNTLKFNNQEALSSRMRVFVIACVVALVALIAGAVSATDFYSGKGNKVLNLTPESFEGQVLKSDKVWFVGFYAPWCGHCKSLAPHWSAAAKAMDGKVAFGAVDAEAHSALGSKYRVQGYPTIVVFGADKSAEPKAYEGQLTTDALVEAAIAEITALTDKRLGRGDKKKDEQKQQLQQEREQQQSAASGFYEGTDVVELTDDTFEYTVLNGKAWLVEFYAPWCGHCKSLTPHWKAAAAAAAAADMGIKVAAIDAAAHTQYANRFGVQGFPTIKFFKPSSFFQTPEEYTGDRDANAIVAYLNDKAALYPGMCKLAEVPQVVGQAELDAKCLSMTLCVVFVINVAHSTPVGRASIIDDFSWVASKFKAQPAAFVWIADTNLFKFEGKFGNRAVHPGIVVLNKERNLIHAYDGREFDTEDAFIAELASLF